MGSCLLVPLTTLCPAHCLLDSCALDKLDFPAGTEGTEGHLGQRANKTVRSTSVSCPETDLMFARSLSHSYIVVQAAQGELTPVTLSGEGHKATAEG